jgi:2-polyprenyl-3-methyl-5-hydroxy-6-metoxy-1,4-benzoquinol methylase
MSLEAVYDRAFFLEYGRANPAYAAACEVIAAELARRFAPRTAIDWGCGAGLHVGALRRAGVEAVGVDAVIPDADLRDPDAVLVSGDLRRPVARSSSLPPRCDLSLSIDVLEHLEDADSAAALANIVSGAALVILSCAPPGQGGHHHVNERPRRYWVARMGAIGWQYQRRETGALERTFLARRDQLPWSWMYHNLCVYRPAPGS